MIIRIELHFIETTVIEAYVVLSLLLLIIKEKGMEVMGYITIFFFILFILSLYFQNEKAEHKKKYETEILKEEKIINDYEKVKYLGGHPLVEISNTTDGNLYLLSDEIRYVDFITKKELFRIPLEDIKGCTAETKESITATRILMTGIFAFALKKQKKYVRIEFKNKLSDSNNIIMTNSNVNKIISDINKRRLYLREHYTEKNEENSSRESDDIISI